MDERYQALSTAVDKCALLPLHFVHNMLGTACCRIAKKGREMRSVEQDLNGCQNDMKIQVSV